MNDELLDRLMKLELNNKIKDSNLNLNAIDIKIRHYQSLINDLEESRPLIFGKKEYDDKLKEYNNEIEKLYKEKEAEVKQIYAMYDDIK